MIFDDRLNKRAAVEIRAKRGNIIYNGREADVICLFGSPLDR